MNQHSRARYKTASYKDIYNQLTSQILQLVLGDQSRVCVVFPQGKLGGCTVISCGVTLNYTTYYLNLRNTGGNRGNPAFKGTKWTKSIKADVFLQYSVIYIIISMASFVLKTIQKTASGENSQMGKSASCQSIALQTNN